MREGRKPLGARGESRKGDRERGASARVNHCQDWASTRTGFELNSRHAFAAIERPTEHRSLFEVIFLVVSVLESSSGLGEVFVANDSFGNNQGFIAIHLNIFGAKCHRIMPSRLFDQWPPKISSRIDHFEELIPGAPFSEWQWSGCFGEGFGNFNEFDISQIQRDAGAEF